MKIIDDGVKDRQILISDDGRVRKIPNGKTVVIRKKVIPGVLGLDYHNGGPVKSTKFIEEAVEMDSAKMMSEDDLPSDSNIVMTEEKIYPNEDIYDEGTYIAQDEPVIKGLSKNEYIESQRESNTNFAKGLPQRRDALVGEGVA